MHMMMRKKRETPDLNFITLACVSMIRVRVAAPRVEKIKISVLFPPPYIFSLILTSTYYTCPSSQGSQY